MNRFLVINPFGIGDVLFTTPIIRALKDKYPGSFLGYWCNQRVGSLLKNNPGIDRVFALSRGDIKRAYKGLKGFLAISVLIRDIRSKRFDAALDFSLDSRYGFWSKLAGINKRIGFNYKGRGRFLTDKIELTGYSGKHVVEYYLDLLEFMDPSCRAHLPVRCSPEGEGGSASYNLDVSKEDSLKAKKILAEYGVQSSDLVIGIVPGGGASWGRDALYKQWPAEKFSDLANKLTKDLNARVILLGSADEKPLAEIIAGKMGQSPSASAKASADRSGTVPIFPSKNIVDLTGKLNIEELAAVIKELKILVCNDSGPLHMAVALGIKTVSIFGPVDEDVYGPYPPGNNHIVVKKELSCRPCYQNFRFNGCFNKRRCLEDVTVNEVYEKVKMLL